jgi:hypothetical protein
MPRTFTVHSAAMPELLGLPALEFYELRGHENLSELFAYTLTLITPDTPLLSEHISANIDYKALVGKELSVNIELDGNTRQHRHITGLVTRARFMQSQDQLTRRTAAPRASGFDDGMQRDDGENCDQLKFKKPRFWRRLLKQGVLHDCYDLKKKLESNRAKEQEILKICKGVLMSELKWKVWFGCDDSLSFELTNR